MGEYCTLDLFRDFTLEHLMSARPPKQQGVCIIKIRKRGVAPEEIVRQLHQQIVFLPPNLAKAGFRWIAGIRNITDCPVIYLGSTRPHSTHTLRERYVSLLHRSSVQYPLWTLLYYGWEMDFGWRVSDNPSDDEAELRRKYAERRQGMLPALVHR